MSKLGLFFSCTDIHPPLDRTIGLGCKCDCLQTTSYNPRVALYLTGVGPNVEGYLCYINLLSTRCINTHVGRVRLREGVECTGAALSPVC
jgi:hypothetical protein